MIGAWVAEHLATIITALIGGAFTIGGIVLSGRGNRAVARLTAEEGAYARARETDDGIVDRLTKERDYLSGQLGAEREGRAGDNARWEAKEEQWVAKEARWEQEKADLRAEAARLEARIREMLAEMIALRERYEVHDGDRPT